MKALCLILMMTVLFSCGQKSGGGSGKDKNKLETPDCCDASELEILQMSEKLKTFWDELEFGGSKQWEKDASVLARSIYFGQAYEKKKEKLTLYGKVIDDKRLGVIFLHFSEAVTNGSRPDLNGLAKNLINTQRNNL